MWFPASFIRFLVRMSASGWEPHPSHSPQCPREPKRAQNRAGTPLINASPKAALMGWIRFHLGTKFEDGEGKRVGSAQNPSPLGGVDVRVEVHSQDHNGGKHEQDGVCLAVPFCEQRFYLPNNLREAF